jgi:hypothetical protein
MANAGYLAPNVARNVSIAHGIRFFYKRTGGTTWIDLGDITDLSVNPQADFVEHFSNHDGQNSLSKRVLSNRQLNIECTLNEINQENLKLMFYGDAYDSTGSINYLYQEVLDFGSALAESDTLTLTETAAPTAVTDITVTLEDGTAVTNLSSADFTFTGNAVVVVAAGALVGEQKINVQYTVALATAQKTELFGDVNATGAAQFHVLNTAGGIIQILELDDIFIAPSGTMNLPADGIQSIPLTITSLVKNNKIGRAYFKNV